jgi:glycosyltransferase involved in cell wall biosynthesis
MELSVIIPAFNAARTIGDALDSVAAQRRKLEVIVVDDGSTDDTAQRAAAAAPDALVLRQPNGGPGRARNRALAHAHGRWLAFLDADDQWYPDALEVLFDYVRRWPAAQVVCATFTRPFIRKSQTRASEPPRRVFCDLFHQRLKIHMGAVIVRREVVEEVGGFDERREVYVEDWDLWLRIAARHPVGHVPRPVVWCREGGVMSSCVDATYSGQLLVVDKLAPLCAEACPQAARDPGACRAARRERTLLAHGRALLRAGGRAEARLLFERAIDEARFALRPRLLWAASLLDPLTLARAYAVRDLLARRGR